MKCFQVELNTEGQGFFLGILLLDVGLRKAVVKEKLPRSWSEPISDLRTHDLIVNVILSRQPWHPTRGFCLSPYYFFSLKNHSHFTHYGGNISTTLYLKKKKKSNNKMNIYFFKKPTAKLHLTAAWKCSWFLMAGGEGLRGFQNDSSCCLLFVFVSTCFSEQSEGQFERSCLLQSPRCWHQRERLSTGSGHPEVPQCWPEHRGQPQQGAQELELRRPQQSPAGFPHQGSCIAAELRRCGLGVLCGIPKPHPSPSPSHVKQSC